jgi:hypothetical protein
MLTGVPWAGRIGPTFDRAIDIFSEPLQMALKHDISGKDAAEFYRNQAQAMLE